jgi:hypothetical protein
MPFNKTKSCKGRYISDEYIYDITEVLKINEYKEKKNNGFINFIQSLNIYGYKKYTDIDCLNKTQYALLCQTELDNMILRKDIQPSTLDKQRLSNEHPKLYKITQKDDEKNKKDKSPDWSTYLITEIKHIENMLIDNEKKIFNSKFIFTNKDYILLPILSDENYPFLISRLTEYKQICEMKCDQNIKNDLIYDFLSNIKFICCITNTMYNKSVFDFNKDNVKILKDIKEAIYKYINNIFKTIEEDTYVIPKYNIITNVVSDKHYKFITIHFSVINKYKYSIHKSIIDLYKSLSLNILITCIESDINCNYYANNINNSNNNYNYKEFITSKKNFTELKTIYFSKPKPVLTHLNNNRYVALSEEEEIDECPLIEGDNTICKLLFDLKNNSDKIEVISMYYPNNKYHTYCSLSTVIKYKNNFYNFSIKSITMDVLFSDKLNEFNTKYIKVLEEDNYKQFNINTIKYTKLPSCVEIIISKMDNFMYKLFDNYYETHEAYKKNLVDLKRDSNIDISVLLFKLWARLYIDARKKGFNIYYKLNMTDTKDPNYTFVQLTHTLLKIPVIGQHILGVVNHSDHFIMYCKNIYTIMLLYFYHYKKTEIDTPEKLKKIIIKLQCYNYNIDTLNTIDNSDLDKLIKRLFHYNLTLTNDIQFYKFIIMYLLKYSVSYLTWYVAPNIMITDYNECNIFILKYIESYKTECSQINFNDKYSLKIFTKINLNDNMYERKDVNSFTNFYKIYIDSGFLHCFRDLTLSYYNELQKLLFNNKDNNGTELIRYLSFFHYPPIKIYAILHMHTYKNHYINTDTIGTHGEFIDTTFGRTILLDKLLFNGNGEMIQPTIQISQPHTIKNISDFNSDVTKYKKSEYSLTHCSRDYEKKYYKYKIKYIKLKAELKIK